MKTNKLWSILMMLVFALGASISFSSCSSDDDDDVPGGGSQTSGTNTSKAPKGVEAIDLGLSVKWANMNIGATSMEDYGDYFAWGETVGYNGSKKTFDISTYKYFMSKDKDGFDVYRNGYTKYVTKSCASEYGYDGFYDDKTVLDPEDDAATANWGGSWRMPTKAELDELCTKCTWEWKELNGKKGCKVTGPNGNFIFLPAAGYRIDGYLYGVDYSFGEYWSSSLPTSGSYSAYSLSLNTRNVDRYCSRGKGPSVRAVCP